MIQGRATLGVLVVAPTIQEVAVLATTAATVVGAEGLFSSHSYDK